MKITDLQKTVCLTSSHLEEFTRCHPKQIVASCDLDVPVWKVKYSYDTARGNRKEAIKYLILNEFAYDCVDNMFNSHIKEINERNPERKISNVEILDVEFLGNASIPLE